MDDTSFLALRRDFQKVPAVAITILVAAEVLPLEALAAPLRLLIVIAWFGSVLALCWTALAPLDRYLEACYAWRFEEAGPALEKTWRLYLHSLRQARRPAVITVGVFFLCLGLETLAAWPPLVALRALAPLYQVGWFVSGLALLAYPLVGGFLVTEAFNRHRMLIEQVETDDARPRSVLELTKQPAAAANRPNVEVLGHYRFRAGGFDWRWEDFHKNAIIFGATGTGKTVCVLNALFDGLMSSASGVEHPAAGLVLDPKGDFVDKLQHLFRRLGREADLVTLDPVRRRDVRWNPLDAPDDDELELAARFAAVLESIGMRQGQESFWVDSAKAFLRHAIALLRLTNEPNEPPSFKQVYELAINSDALKQRLERMPFVDERADQALAYFADHWLVMASDTRSGVQGHLTNMLDPFLMEPYATVFSGRSTVRMAEVLDQGKVLYVHMPLAEKEAMAKVVGTFAKLEFYREVLRRPDKVRRSFFLCDEFQAFMTQAPGRGDADFFERSRQSNHVNLIATQNIPALEKVLEKEPAVHNLLGNCGLKFFLRNDDAKTNKYASELFGEKLVAMMSQNLGGGGAGMRAGAAQGANLNYDARVRKEVFTRLAVPAREEGLDVAESICHVASRARVTKERLRWKVHPLSA